MANSSGAENPDRAFAAERLSFASTVEEMVESTAPHQRALLGVLSVADRYQLDPKPLLAGLALELPTAISDRVIQLAVKMEQGLDTVEALEQIPSLLPSTCVLALQLARENGTVPALYAAWTERHADGAQASFRVSENQPSKVVRLIGRIFVILFFLGFLVVKIVPEFKSMFAEFDIEFPAAMNLLIQTANFAAAFWFLGVLLMLALFPFCFSAVRNFWRSWNWRTWRQPPVSPPVNRRRSLAMVAQTDDSLTAGLSVIAKIRPLQRVFKGLGKASERIEDGQPGWESLAAERIITGKEAEALELTGTADAQAWLLRWSASQRKIRETTRMAVAIRCIMAVVNVGLGLLVALACIAVFMCLLTIMSSFNQIGF